MPVVPGPSDPTPTGETDLPACGAWCAPSDLTCDTTEISSPVIDAAISLATLTLYEFTRSRWPGVCSTVIRPCARRYEREGPALRPTTWWPGPGALRGAWGVCGCNRSVSCGTHFLSEIDLMNDVVEVTEVKVNGDVVDPAEYELQAGRFLVAVPPRRWPCCQRLDRTDDDDGTWSVGYRYGYAPPAAGRTQAAVLACELLKAEGAIEGQCQLPTKVTSVVRQGVTIGSLSPADLFPKALTGIASVDLFVQAILVGHESRPGTFTTPGVHSVGRRR